LLWLEFGDESVAVSDADVRIGRDPSCEVVIDHPKVSRFHATVERRRGRFVIRDHSTNGSMVAAPGISHPTFIRREEHPLQGRGTLSFGRVDPACSVRFKLG
jgi:pSer/pThr/pTyr-binding forkhead associated (FHA) protein